MIINDVVIACADLAGRAGARDFEIGYVHDDVPIEEAGWYAQVSYQGFRLIVQDHRSPGAAALAMAVRLMDGATCRCRKPVSLSDDCAGCRWRLAGQRWEPGCDAPSVKVEGKAGDYAAIRRAMEGPQS